MELDIAGYRISGLNPIFPETELAALSGHQAKVITILGYFATSLFDKNNVNEVLWDITENCISFLQLEDCVIYLLDSNRSFLTQKAAFGNKQLKGRKILSPIKIPYGSGIVGTVAQTGKSEIIGDVTKDPRYILDDLQRYSELCVPMISKGKVIGVIDTEHSRKNFFKESHLSIFDLIARLTVKKLECLLEGNKSSFTNDNAYYSLFCSLLKEEKLYRDEQLSLTQMAERIKISPGYLSQIINTVGGQRFSDIVNHYRVEEAKERLKSADYRNYTVEGIGYEVGFNSKSAFYSAFKKRTGLSPVVYREIG